MCNVIIILVSFLVHCACHPSELAWYGGPLHLECEHANLLTLTGQCVKENVIAIKAITYREDVYVLTPRLKHGVLATIWTVVKSRKGPELQAYPDMQTHALADCRALQNAVDFHMDQFSNLWVLDSGVIESQQYPRCTCPPKVLVISLLLDRVTRTIDLVQVAEPTSLLQSIVVEYTIGGKAFVYVTDASRGAVLVHDVSSGAGWAVVVCARAAGLQAATSRRGAAHAALVLVRVPHAGLIELDTAALRRRDSVTPLTVFAEHSKPILLLGSSGHHIFLRHAGCTDVLAWDSRQAFNTSLLERIHTPSPTLVPTSAAVDNLGFTVVILDSNYADTVAANTATYHRISFIDGWK